MGFEKQQLNDKPMSHWLDDAVEILDHEGLPFSAEAVREIRKRVEQLENQVDILKKYARWTFWASDDWCDNLDGADIQEKAEKMGLIKETQMAEPCGDRCACADVYGLDEFPVTCYRYVDWLEEADDDGNKT